MEQVKQHDGYIVPFDIPSESLKKGDILRHKNGLDDDMFENIVVLNSSYCLPPEWVETWDKYYHEEVKQTAVQWLHEIAKQREPDKFDWQQAKAIEKEQIIKAIDYCRDKYIDSENYYNETYGE